MTTDKVFILLLVIMLPLTGCLDIADNAESQDATTDETQIMVNNPPVIYYTSASFGDIYDYSTNTLIENVIRVSSGMAVDFDGQIVEFGIDTNQDGVIDFPLNETGGDTVIQAAYNPDNMTDWMEPMPYDYGSMSSDVERCYQWLSLIAIDDGGAMSVEPFMAWFEYDDNEAMACELESINN
jgi:hypothetical protein